ncbi:hypothetical protein [Nocardioides sp. AX2bis]|uniref:hypothetical protein n=1 Tax=Nocardioides sp. AX2bis TaxID=2653157 RepID=UPI0012EFCE42|nr:hypothetical protein [Nocardioides sp. AX2bis]VXB65829.1 hypothetical protein NOCARDAX2BIS_30024 [Nocardioides sp. AX2bis]
MNHHDTVSRLAPTPQELDPQWSTTALARILAEQPTAPPRRRRRVVALSASGLLALTAGAGTAFALSGPGEVVKEAILGFAESPDTTGYGLGRLEDPLLVAEFDDRTGHFALWIAGSSTGKTCYAVSHGEGAWDGTGVPTEDQLEYGCDPLVVGPDGRSTLLVTRPDQLGGFFDDQRNPIVYGVSPYADAVAVRVTGDGVDRTLPVRPDSLGYGAALPEAASTRAVRLTFLDAAGVELGSKRSVAPVG